MSGLGPGPGLLCTVQLVAPSPGVDSANVECLSGARHCVRCWEHGCEQDRLGSCPWSTGGGRGPSRWVPVLRPQVSVLGSESLRAWSVAHRRPPRSRGASHAKETGGGHKRPVTARGAWCGCSCTAPLPPASDSLPKLVEEGALSLLLCLPDAPGLSIYFPDVFASFLALKEISP